MWWCRPISAYCSNAPIVTIGNVTSISYTSATVAGNVTDDGGATITSRGVCYGTSYNPTISGNKVISGSGTGSFSANLTGLTAGTTYYVRAYATNSAGTGYSNNATFTTTAITIPTVTTGTVSSITVCRANISGSVTSDGGSTVTERGVCYGTSANPTISGDHTVKGSGTGSFTVNLFGLSASTTYYVRAYATNSAGTAYGTQTTFTTSASTMTLPNAILNLDIFNMTATSIKEKVSGSYLTRTSPSYLTFTTTSNFGRAYAPTSRNATIEFSCTYSQSNFPALYNVMQNSTAPYSILMIINPKNINTASGTKYRQGLLALYNFLSFIGYTDGANNKLLQAFMPRGTAGGTGSGIASYFQPIGNTGISYFYVGIDTNGTYYYDANGVLQTNTTIKRNGVAGTPVSGSKLVLNRSQETSYYAQTQQYIYGITIYDGILSAAQIDYLVNQNHATCIQ